MLGISKIQTSWFLGWFTQININRTYFLCGWLKNIISKIIPFMTFIKII